MYWKQRSRENWLKLRDMNTKWFHNRASIRRQKNHIRGVEIEDNSWSEDIAVVKHRFISYSRISLHHLGL